MECVFCKIINGEIPSMKIYEDDNTLVFMDIAKDVDGHMLAIPKKHINSIFDCDDKSLGDLISTVKLVSDHCVEKCGYNGVNLLNANGESSGQSVSHFHIHIIPRKQDDNIDAWPDFKGANFEVEEIYNQIKIK